MEPPGVRRAQLVVIDDLAAQRPRSLPSSRMPSPAVTPSATPAATPVAAAHTARAGDVPRAQLVSLEGLEEPRSILQPPTPMTAARRTRSNAELDEIDADEGAADEDELLLPSPLAARIQTAVEKAAAQVAVVLTPTALASLALATLALPLRHGPAAMAAAAAHLPSALGTSSASWPGDDDDDKDDGDEGQGRGEDGREARSGGEGSESEREQKKAVSDDEDAKRKRRMERESLADEAEQLSDSMLRGKSPLLASASNRPLENYSEQPRRAVIDHRPGIFIRLRALSRVDEKQYLESFTLGLKTLRSPGKSGSFFFATSDMRFIIKSLTVSEAQFLCDSLLEPYLHHLKDNPGSLLARLCGLHTLRIHDGTDVIVSVMLNVLPFGAVVRERYDLKGSTVGRLASAKEKLKADCVLKDLDFLRRKQKLRLDPTQRTELLEALDKDTAFLESQQVIDYSILLDMMDVDYMNEDNPSGKFSDLVKEGHGWVSGVDENGIPQGEVYHLGIVDFSQYYNLRKKLEVGIKSLISDKDQISVADPQTYRHANSFLPLGDTNRYDYYVYLSGNVSWTS
eukprot:m51a1_g5522 putative 1-phosphatidylinositol-4-phosphate 5-kinase (570) ;mRNA; f:420710-422563